MKLTTFLSDLTIVPRVTVATAIVLPSPVPFKYPPLVLRELAGKPEGPELNEAGPDDPADWWKAPDGLTHEPGP